MSVREVGSPVSTGITASAPYVIEKQVSLVEWFDKPIAHLEALPPTNLLSHPVSSLGHLLWTCWSLMPNRCAMDKKK